MKLALLATKTTAMKMIALPALKSCRPPLRAAASRSLAFPLSCAARSDAVRVRLIGRPNASICDWMGPSSLPMASSKVDAVPVISESELMTDEAITASTAIATTTVATRTRPAAAPRGRNGRRVTIRETTGSMTNASSQARKNMTRMLENALTTLATRYVEMPRAMTGRSRMVQRSAACSRPERITFLPARAGGAPRTRRAPRPAR